MKILAINFGSTSTKLAVFEDETRLDERSISHDPAELLKFDDVYDQYDMRKALVDEFLADNGLGTRCRLRHSKRRTASCPGRGRRVPCGSKDDRRPI